MKIDFHVHVTPPDIISNWKKYAKKETYFSMLCQNKYHKFTEAENVVISMENEDIDKSVIFGWAFSDIGLCRYVNDYVIEKVKKFPDKLIGFAVVPPCKGAEAEIQRCHSLGLKGVGELFPKGQKIDLENKKNTSLFTDICNELSIPVLIHTNEPVGHYYSGKTDINLAQIETFIKNNPNLNIILAHWGGGLFLYEMMKEVSIMFKNVYYDTAITPFLYDSRVYSAVKALKLCKKVLFGTDYPLLPPSRYMNALEESDLSEHDKLLILGKNASDLLKLNTTEY